MEIKKFENENIKIFKTVEINNHDVSRRKVFAICFALFVNALNVGFLFLAQHLHNILNNVQQITKSYFAQTLRLRPFCVIRGNL